MLTRFLGLSALMISMAYECRAEAASMEELRVEVLKLKEVLQQLTVTVSKQQQLISELMNDPNKNLATPQISGGRVAAPSAATVRAVGSSPQFNPDIGVVADIVGTLSESQEDEEGNDRLSVREIELVLGHDVDPYSRLDFTAAYSDSEDVHLDEAFLTYWALPWEIQARLGRLRPRVGIAAAAHRDTLDTVDEPLVVSELFGEEGYSRTGIELSGYLPFPWTNVTHELIGGVLEGGVGHEGTLLGSTRRRPTYFARVRNFWEIDDESSLSLGSTFLAGSSDEDSANEVRVLGIDAAYGRITGTLGRLDLSGEIYIQDRSAPVTFDDDTVVAEEVSFDENPIGTYLLLDYRFAQRWAAGARWDYLESVNIDEDLARDRVRAYSAYVTFLQSEFARLRFQYRHEELFDGGSDNVFLLQTTAAIGTHKHQLQ